jgi:beta-lactamase class A
MPGRPPFLLLAGVLAAGLAGGFLLRGALPTAGPGTWQQRRAHGYRFTNPLLECDVGVEALANQELRPFRAAVEAALVGISGATGRSRSSVYFRELNDGRWFVVGEAERFVPASLRKVPLLIALLKQVEQRNPPDLFERELRIDLKEDHVEGQNLRPSEPVVRGRRYRVGELVRRMIVQSDNNAFVALTGIVDRATWASVLADLTELDPAAPIRGEQLSAETYAGFFRMLYNASYLGRDASEWALALLAQSEFRAGIVAGVPNGIPVAHKFGENSDASTGTVQLHDCGIVYHPDRPYLLCVMTSGADFELLDDAIREVSRVVFAAVDAENRRTAKP